MFNSQPRRRRGGMLYFCMSSGRLPSQVFIAQGDITNVLADAIAVSRGVSFSRASGRFAALAGLADGDDFLAEYERARGAATNRPAFWVPLGPTPTPSLKEREAMPRGVVFVTVDQREGAYAAVQHAIVEAVYNLPPNPACPYLIALVAFRMSQGGDRNDRLRSAGAQIQAAYDTLADLADRNGGEPAADVVFVVDDPGKYEIFLDARRREMSARGLGAAAIDPEWLPLIEAIKNEECVLFVGAGLSLNARMPSYRQLVEAMAAEIGIAEEISADVDTYLDIAQAYRDSPRSVPALVAKHYGNGRRNARPSIAHYLLMSLPIRFIVTTNYDRLLEMSLESLRRFPIRIVDDDHIGRTGYRDGLYVVKFHGDAGEGDVVVSRDDYDAFFHRRPAMASLLEGLLLNQTFFFVGYSLRDPNYRQIYSKIDLMLRSSKRPAFAATLTAPRLMWRPSTAASRCG